MPQSKVCTYTHSLRKFGIIILPTANKWKFCVFMLFLDRTTNSPCHSHRRWCFAQLALLCLAHVSWLNSWRLAKLLSLGSCQVTVRLLRRRLALHTCSPGQRWGGEWYMLCSAHNGLGPLTRWLALRARSPVQILGGVSGPCFAWLGLLGLHRGGAIDASACAACSRPRVNVGG